MFKNRTITDSQLAGIYMHCISIVVLPPTSTNFHQLSSNARDPAGWPSCHNQLSSNARDPASWPSCRNQLCQQGQGVLVQCTITATVLVASYTKKALGHEHRGSSRARQRVTETQGEDVPCGDFRNLCFRAYAM